MGNTENESQGGYYALAGGATEVKAKILWSDGRLQFLELPVQISMKKSVDRRGGQGYF